ncbi:MAG TPA: gliding motility-associated C-terminal domain-containing protein [Bacteroidales bacterium]|nr:gliding motility-associated C-terminal domain-containing protein [Bacteroidales bacterium]HSA42269.1 gliding motility-associated C-terminal domain-containing protein [Bacteroidales bacterium]
MTRVTALSITLGLFISSLTILNAQPPCATNPIAGDYCSTATPICNLNGYCGNTSAFYTNTVSATNSSNETFTPLGAVFCATIQNNSWLKFIADSTVAIFDVWCSNCQINRGIQMQIYSTTDCYNYIPFSNCWNPQTPTNGQIMATGLTPGNVYFFMIDGAMGDVCDYVIACSVGVNIAPVISPDQTICENSTATLSALGGINYLWTSFPLDPSLTGQQNNATIMVTPAVTTTYTALIVNPGLNNFCANDTTILQTVVSINNVNVQAAGVVTAHCGHADGSITVTGSGGDSTYTYVWNTTPPQYTPTLSGVPAGTYTVTVTSDGCSKTASFTVPDAPGPTLSMTSYSNAHCNQANGNVYTQAAGGTPPYTYLWNTTPPQTTSNLQNVWPGNYTLTVTDSNLCTATYSIILTNEPGPTVNFSPPAPMCENHPPIYLNGGSPAGGTYTGPGITGNIFNASQAGNGTHQIIYTYADIFGCIGADTQFVTINAIPLVTMPSLPSLCADAEAFTLSGGLPSGGYYIGTAVVNGIFDPSASGTGIFSLGYTYSDSIGCGDTAYQSIQVLPLPLVSLADINPVCISDSIVLISGGLPAGGTYSGPYLTGTEFFPSLSGSGTFTITYTYSDTAGCTNADSTIMEVIPLPLAFQVGGGGTMCAGTPGLAVTLDSSQTGITYTLLLNGHMQGFPFSGTGSPLSFSNQSLAGIYTIHAVDPDHNCQNDMAGSVEIRVYPSPAVDLGEDLYLCDLPELLLDAGTYADSVQYEWQDGHDSREFRANAPGFYWVKVYLGNCYGIDSLEVMDCSDLELPNVFTPNDDQINDRFIARKTGEIIDFHIIVFNRWGNTVYDSGDLAEGWDGTLFNRGNDCAEGVYFFTAAWVSIIYPQEPRPRKINGSVTLLR